MESLAAPPVHEKSKSFDPLASVNMLRHDCERFGFVLPETRDRVRDEELSYLVEAVDRAARTTFVLGRDRDDLVYFDRGSWRPYTGMLLTGLQVAEREAQVDPRRQFLAEWAARDFLKGQAMNALRPGEQMVWHSSYPHELEAQFGAKFLRDCGLVTDRKMGFFYRAACRADGSVTLESQTVDGSDEEAFAVAMQTGEAGPDITMDTLVYVYDGVLTQKYDDYFYAGRREADTEENAWNVINQHRDLIRYLLDGLESIAADQYLDDTETAAKQHVYGVWAAFKKRLDIMETANASTGLGIVTGGIVQHVLLEQEVRTAFLEFAARGVPMVGCGGAISVAQGESGVLNASSEEVFDAIFGKKVTSADDGDCEFVSKTCPSCGAKNVKTTVRRKGTRKHVTGKCGCTKTYSVPS